MADTKAMIVQRKSFASYCTLAPVKGVSVGDVKVPFVAYGPKPEEAPVPVAVIAPAKLLLDGVTAAGVT